MRVQPSSEDWRLARTVHEMFASRPGAERIASEFALAHLSAVLHAHRPASVLEFGAGIGTITHLLLTHPARPANVVSTEENDFCLRQLEHNIAPESRDGWELVANDEPPRRGKAFDLVIIDGHVMGLDLSPNLKAGTIIFAEGNRKPERAWMQQLAARRGLSVDFTNHFRGRRLVSLQWTRHKKPLAWPRLRFFRKVKGCWIGRVTQPVPS